MKAKKDFVYTPEVDEYTLRLKHRNLWWLLLFLIPLVLLIPLKKDVVLKIVENNTNNPITQSQVYFEYHYRALIDFSDFRFFVNDIKNYSGKTNTQGEIKFENVRYTLYSLIFFYSEKTLINADAECMQQTDLQPRFTRLHNNKAYVIPIDLETYSLDIKVVDKSDGTPLPGATVTAACNNGKKQEAVSDASGFVRFEKIPVCCDIKINGTKIGYEDDNIQGKVKNLIGRQEDRTLYLEPVFEIVQFFVKDLYTKKPIPNAKAELVINGKSVTEITNTDGVGKGAFQNIPAASKMYINVTHVFYYDTTSREYLTADFVKLSDEERTIYMRPKAHNIIFKDIDGKTGQPLEGVKNLIYINGRNIGIQFSDANGEFTVAGVNPGATISITASKAGYTTNDYTIKNKNIDNLTTQADRTIPLDSLPRPRAVKQPRKGCRAHFSGTLLSDRVIKGHISKIYVPDEYGEYVGEGDYPSNRRAFPNAVRTTFDGIAVDKGTRVIIYSKENFKGKVLLDVTGPAVINNVKWKYESRIKNFTTKTFSGPLQANFPQSCRRWSSSDMNNWSSGSVKVICEDNN